MTETDDAARPPDSPALQRAESAIRDAQAAAEAGPAEQAPLLAEAQARLADLLAERADSQPPPPTPSPTPDQH